MGKKLLQVLPWVSLLAACTYFLVIIAMNEVPKDDGDGLQHFSIAKVAWEQPSYFLDHWGKPLFTFFSSFFAPFGFQAYSSFNVLVFFATVFVLFRLLKREKSPILFMSFVPWLLISIPDYTYSIVGGLTEPFFGLLLTLMLYASIRKKWGLFALLASLAPFARSEGMLVLLAAAGLLLYTKSWKALPWLLTGPIISLIAGQLILGQALWYLENDPYPELSPYGSGSWMHYATHFTDYFGLINLLYLPIAIFGMLVWRQHHKKHRTLILLFFSGIFFGILIIHSYFWANGLRGSMGLTRIGLQGMPAFIGLCFLGLSSVFKELHFVGIGIFGSLTTLGIFREIVALELPTHESSSHKMIHRAVNYVNHAPIHGKIYYMHPMVAYYNGLGTKDQHERYIQRFIHLEKDVVSQFKPGDILFRDSKFGATEQGLSFEELQKYPFLIPVKHFYSEDYNPEFNGESKSVILYQVVDPKAVATFKRSDHVEIPASITGKIHGTAEFTDHRKVFALPALRGPKQELIIAYTLQAEKEIYLVFDDGRGLYVSQPMLPGEHQLILPFVTGKQTGKLYIHNPEKKAFTCAIRTAKWRQTRDVGIQEP